MTVGLNRPVTIRDVARAAGVSHQTVSRVLNHHQSVSPGTRELVIRIIQQLGYRPNSAARSLVTRRSHQVGLITVGTAYFGPAQTVAGVETALRDKGYTLLLATLRTPDLKELYDLIEQLIAQTVDGLVLITPIIGIQARQIKKLCGDIPFLSLDTGAATNSPVLAINQRLGARLAVEHLRSLGHTRIAEISGPLHWGDARQRHDALVGALSDHNLTFCGNVPGSWEAESGYHAVNALVESGSDFTALVVGNDQMALGAMRGLRENGFKVPEDVSVIGFNDLPEAAYYEPPLSSVQQNFPAFGKQCADLLVSLISGEPLSIPQPPEPTLVSRASTTYSSDQRKG